MKNRLYKSYSFYMAERKGSKIFLRKLHEQEARLAPQVDGYGRPIVSPGTVSRFLSQQELPYQARVVEVYGGGEGEQYPGFKVGETEAVFLQPDGSLSPYDPDSIEGVLAAENGRIRHGIDPKTKRGNGYRSPRR